MVHAGESAQATGVDEYIKICSVEGLALDRTFKGENMML